MCLGVSDGRARWLRGGLLLYFLNDTFLLILVSDLSVWYEDYLLMARPVKFEFLTISPRKDRREGLQN